MIDRKTLSVWYSYLYNFFIKEYQMYLVSYKLIYNPYNLVNNIL